MLIDIVSVFPEYFSVLDLSLLGKAQSKGLVEVRAHNLRDWTHDVHHSVDDTPVGGGAGMVMKPAVWAECLDELLGLEPHDMPQVDPTAELWDEPVESAASEEPTGSVESAVSDGDATVPEGRLAVSDDQATVSDNQSTPDTAHYTPDTVPDTVLIFPNPSAPLFTQRDATQLSHAQRLVFGCGRYEGYDARVPRYYKARGVDVREYSIGDYVLNGGEVAVSVMLEAITRLIPGFMGNPDSIVEESYTGSNALLEHLQYTRPTTWRGITVPAVLTSGDHGKVDRYRRDQALARTADIRPDLIEKLDCTALSKADRKTLIALGWEVSGRNPRKLQN
ncbi:MAG: tRNA (guanosine(37)-N1)-methyltransferase TrmD [Bifidobacteriaceae bacterium]|nr:tRNA (guanosine(37)-N1)-methyltransferase TrmD [Bifidobacteriaceae bacterium]